MSESNRRSSSNITLNIASARLVTHASMVEICAQRHDTAFERLRAKSIWPWRLISKKIKLRISKGAQRISKLRALKLLSKNPYQQYGDIGSGKN